MLIRIITALIGIIVAVGVITCGGYFFAAAVLFLGILAWYEIFNMAKNKGLNIFKITSGGGVLALLLLGNYFFLNNCEQNDFMSYAMMTIVAFLILITLEGLYRHCEKGEKWVENVALSTFAFLYCGLLFFYVLLIRSFTGEQVYFFKIMDFGEGLLWLALLGTWASDTFAYFIGCAFGKHKFCSVSPKKSWEGAIGGFLGSVAVVMLFGVYVLHLSILQAGVLGMLIGFVAPVGDLVESVLKRSFDVKDSGKIFPGHGGVLDRFDSLLFVAPVVYYVMLIFTKF